MGLITTKAQKKEENTVHFQSVNTSNLLLIFTRNPVLGKCKTRLAATIGDEAALNIYKFLLKHTAEITEHVNAHKQVYYSEDIWEDDIWDSMVYEKALQEGVNLGDRMANAFKKGFENDYNKVIVIGSDMYDLNSNDLTEAFKALDQHNYVLGPAEDGGYYLLGMNVYNKNLFLDKKWGTNTVLSNTLKDLNEENVFLLKTKNDIDLYEDIENIKAFEPYLKNL